MQNDYFLRPEDLDALDQVRWAPDLSSPIDALDQVRWAPDLSSPTASSRLQWMDDVVAHVVGPSGALH
jgi:hypothetical protein